ncbi:MAG: ArsR/SmtB family transcription factor [Pseudomarimonas sp.]
MNSADAVLALSALSHETRLTVFRLLVQAGPEGLAVGELRDHLQVAGATLTAHLNILRAAALVADERQGRVIRMRANYAQMDTLLAYLTENCCAGKTQCGPSAVCTPPKRGARR